MNELEREVWKVVSDMNRAWSVDLNTDVLKDYFHKDMVAITATDRERIVGRDACVAAWKLFVDRFHTDYFRETDPLVQIHAGGTCAVVTCYFDMFYSAGESKFTAGGRDMFVLVKEDGKWWIIADQFSPYPLAA